MVKILSVLLFVSLAISMVIADTCVVNPQVTSSVALTISTNTSNLVIFKLALPDEKTASTNTATHVSFSYTEGACSDNRLVYDGDFPNPSSSATSVDSAEAMGTSGWKAYRVVSTSPCDIVYLFRELPLDDFLGCLVYDTKTTTDLVYNSGTPGTLTRTYTIEQTADGVTTSTTATVQDLFEFHINVQEQYNFDLSNVQMSVQLMGDPINPDGNAVIKSVAVTNDGANRKFSIHVLATSKFPFELRTGATGTDAVSLSLATSWVSATVAVLARCDTTNYVIDGQTCVQELVVEVITTPCDANTLALNIPNDKLQYGCADGTAASLLCPLANDSVITTGTFVATYPIDLTITSGSTCKLTDGYNFDAALQATLTPVNGLIASGGVGPWDNTARKRYLYKSTNNIYFNIEVTNVATVTVVSWVDVDHIDVLKTAQGASNFTASYSYHTDGADKCNTTVSINGNSVYRTCAVVKMDTGFSAPSDNAVDEYFITVHANVYLRDKNQPAGTKKRAALAFDVVSTQASSSFNMVSKADSTGSTATGGSSSSVTIAASVGAVGAALVVGLVAVLIVVFKTKAAVAAAAAAPVASV